MAETKESYPFIKTRQDSLSRSIETPDSTVLCKCDGTSSSVRACLALTDENLYDDSDVDSARCHRDYTQTCAKKGLKRLSAIIHGAEKGLKR